MVTIRSSGSGLPILPRGTNVVSSTAAPTSSLSGNNVLKIALPTTANRLTQKTQRIILPSEAIKVIDTSGGHKTTPQIQPKKVRKKSVLSQICLIELLIITKRNFYVIL